jgi:hypothetical protein
MLYRFPQASRASARPHDQLRLVTLHQIETAATTAANELVQDPEVSVGSAALANLLKHVIPAFCSFDSPNFLRSLSTRSGTRRNRQLVDFDSSPSATKHFEND